uniref:AlNc14C13G1596 protein n=1 Tax=Albugo laibachii Nc14 TaxID=890382 RepID=F0W3N6_9STRA|nr:AlNc14C13G1596 [Albugo laibachii Nc14]|eukprot:CCA15679.1 AlNc14C13G1596 [Albugo laibachii Nc14]
MLRFPREACHISNISKLSLPQIIRQIAMQIFRIEKKDCFLLLSLSIPMTCRNARHLLICKQNSLEISGGETTHTLYYRILSGSDPIYKCYQSASQQSPPTILASMCTRVNRSTSAP